MLIEFRYTVGKMALTSRISETETALLEQLLPIFPNLDKNVILRSIKHPSNKADGIPQFQLCIDDLLELRTFTEMTAVQEPFVQSVDCSKPTVSPDLEGSSSTSEKWLPRLPVEKSSVTSAHDDLDLVGVKEVENLVTSPKDSVIQTFETDYNSKSLSTTSGMSSSSDKENILHTTTSVVTQITSPTTCAITASVDQQSIHDTVAKSPITTFVSKDHTSVNTSVPSTKVGKPRDLYDTHWSDSETDSSQSFDSKSFELSDSDDDLPKLFAKDSRKECDSKPSTSSNIGLGLPSACTSVNSGESNTKPILLPGKLFQQANNSTSGTKNMLLSPPRLILKKTISVKSPVANSPNVNKPESSVSGVTGVPDSFLKFRDHSSSTEDEGITDGDNFKKASDHFNKTQNSNKIYKSCLLSPAKLKIKIERKPDEDTSLNNVLHRGLTRTAIPPVSGPSTSYTSHDKDSSPIASSSKGSVNVPKEEKTMPRSKEAGGFDVKRRLMNDNRPFQDQVIENLEKNSHGWSQKKGSKSVEMLKKLKNQNDTSIRFSQVPDIELLHTNREPNNNKFLSDKSHLSSTINPYLNLPHGKLPSQGMDIHVYQPTPLPTTRTGFKDVKVISENLVPTLKGSPSNPYMIDIKKKTSPEATGLKATTSVPRTFNAGPVTNLTFATGGPVNPVPTEPQPPLLQTKPVAGQRASSTVGAPVNLLFPNTQAQNDLIDLTLPVDSSRTGGQLQRGTDDILLVHEGRRQKNRVTTAAVGAPSNQRPDITLPAGPVVLPDFPVTAVPSREDSFVSTVLSMFPDISETYVKGLVQNYLAASLMPDNDIVNTICNHLLENPAYPRKEATVTLVSTEQTTKEESMRDFYSPSEYADMASVQCKMQTEQMLQSHFPWISVREIRTVMKLYRGHYAPSHQVFTKVMKQKAEEAKDPSKTTYSGSRINVTITVDGTERSLGINFLRCCRRVSPPSSLTPELQREVDFVIRKQAEAATEADHQIALELNVNEYEETGQLIECGCCYDEVTFDNMVQCCEGHLFCQMCLQRYAKEAVFGSGKADLLCMTDGCDATYPQTQLNKALPKNILSKYEDRVQEENINLADLPDLVRCPYCEFAAVLDPGYPVFECLNTTCLKKSCRHCKENWSDHIGKTCEQVEKKDEVKIRVQFEEKMSEAKIRTCHKCKTKFTKSEGCNRMTCRCGATMCYICRKPDISYKHFCQHVRNPGQGCTSCKDCFLWSTGEEDDKRAIAEIKKQANVARKAEGFKDILIGAPDDEPVTKKARLNNNRHY